MHRKWVWMTLSITGILLLLNAALVYIIDPLMLFHPPYFGTSFLRSSDDQIVTGIARHVPGDIVVVGGSLAKDIDEDLVSSYFPGRVVRVVALHGSSPIVGGYLLRLTLQRLPKPRVVIVCLDLSSLVRDPPEHALEYLDDVVKVREMSYLLSRQTVATWIRGMLQFGKSSSDLHAWVKGVQRHGTAHSPSEQPKNYFRLSKVRQRNGSPSPRPTSTEALMDLIEREIFVPVSLNPEVRFVLFQAPISFASWTLAPPGSVSTFDSLRYSVARSAQEYKNVEYHDFSAERSVTTNLGLYGGDLFHYVPEVNDWILAELIRGSYRLTSENLHEMPRLEPMVAAYTIPFTSASESDERRIER